jgi:hypothetical protein
MYLDSCIGSQRYWEDNRLRIRVLTSVFLAAAISSFAAPIPGDLDISGSVRIGSSFADYTPLGGNVGMFNIEPTSTGSFTSLVVPVNSDDGDILDLAAAVAPVGLLFSLPNWLTFAADPTITFELTFINPGVFGACIPGAIFCSVNQFNLIDTGGSTVANFNVRGNVYDDGVIVATYVGSFSNSFAGQRLAGLLGTVATQGYIDSAFEGNFTATAIPEPSSMWLFASGGFLTALLSCIRRKSS